MGTPVFFNPRTHVFASFWVCLIMSSPRKHQTILGFRYLARRALWQQKWILLVLLNTFTLSGSWRKCSASWFCSWNIKLTASSNFTAAAGGKQYALACASKMLSALTFAWSIDLIWLCTSSGLILDSHNAKREGPNPFISAALPLSLGKPDFLTNIESLFRNLSRCSVSCSL